MHKLLATLFTIFITSNLSLSQSDSTWYKAKVEDFKTTPQFAQKADAWIILDSGYSKINEDLQLEFTHTTRVKINSEGGKSWAKVVIPFGLSDSVSFVKASSYLLINNQVLQSDLLSENIQKVKKGNIIEYYFEIPEVKVGSIIQYSYQLIVSDWKKLNNWYFQNDIPVLHSTYTTQVPNYILFYKFLEGNRTLKDLDRKTVREIVKGKQTEVLLETYTMDSIPAFVPEFDTPGDNYFISKIKFHLAEYTIPGQETNYVLPQSYEELAYNWASDSYFRQVYSSANYLTSVIDKIHHPELPKTKLIQSYYYFVRNNFTIDQSQGDKGLETVFKERTGTSLQINMLLIKLLNQAGFNAYLSALSTIDNRPTYPELPYFELFDQFITMVRYNEQNYFLDPSDKNLLFNMLPPQFINGGALIVSRVVPGFADVEFNYQDKEMVTAEFNITDSAKITGKYEVKREGYAVYSFDSRFLTNNRSYNDYIIETIFENMNWTIRKHEVNPVFDGHKHLKEELIYTRSADSIAKNYMEISPIVLNEFEVNPYEAKTRQNPLTLYTPLVRKSSYSYKIPDGWVVKSIPKSNAISLADGKGKFYYEAKKVGNTLQIDYSINNDKVIIMPGEYAQIRKFYEEVSKTLNQRIILIK